MMHGMNVEQWAGLATRYAIAYSDDKADELLETCGKDEQDALDRIKSLHRLVMDETDESWTQEWRDNLTAEEAAAVAVLDEEIDRVMFRIRLLELLELHENVFGLPEW